MAIEAINAGITSEKIVVIEKSDVHSFSIRKFYPDQKPVTANYKGQEAICTGVMCITDTSKEGTLSYLDKAIEDYKVNVHYKESVHKIHPNQDGSFLIETDKETYHAKSCVIAIGIFGKPNRPSYAIPREIKEQVHFDVTSIEIKDSKVLIVGGGDSASEYAQFLHEKGNQVSLSYRRADFNRMNSINRESLLSLEEQAQVRVLRSSNIKTLCKEDKFVRVDFEEVMQNYLLFDHVIYALGGTSPKNFLKTIGIEFDGESPIVTEGYETSIPGLFLVGDLSAGKKGGSIISAFNSAQRAMETLCKNHLECKL